MEGRVLRPSNLGKVLYPAAGFTKAQVIDYYARIAPAILPHLRNRPVTLKRYPDGVEGEFFFEKTCPSHRPPWVATADVPSRHRGLVRYCLCNDLPTLLWLANLAALELHTLLATVEDLGRPTHMVFDLDPGPGADLVDCIRVAMRFRQVLEELRLAVMVKTSGGKGLHLYVPLGTVGMTFEQTKPLARELALRLESQDPARITSNMRRELRTGRVFIDWSQNDQHKTTVCVYSLRARPVPAVSTPVKWKELEAAHRRRDASGLRFTPAEVLRRVEREGDLF